jgi:hypothetical protein
LAFTLILLHLERPVCYLFFQSIDVSLEIVDSLTGFFVVLEEAAIVFSLLFGIRHVSIEINFEFLVEILNLLDQVMLHRLEFLHVLVLSLLSERLEVILHLLKFCILLLINRLNHVL